MTTALRADRLAELGRGIAARYARTLRAIDRLDALDGRSGALASEELRDDPGAADALARELVARLLRVAADARLAPVLRTLVADGGQGLAGLAVRQGASRLALLRRADDLVDAGLADRDPERDLLIATPLGAALVALLDQIESATAAALGAP
ncbi:MAG: hypothetical protein ACYC9W_05040 [Candidatus Limnocylindria bacterium]